MDGFDRGPIPIYNAVHRTRKIVMNFFLETLALQDRVDFLNLNILLIAILARQCQHTNSKGNN